MRRRKACSFAKAWVNQNNVEVTLLQNIYGIHKINEWNQERKLLSLVSNNMLKFKQTPIEQTSLKEIALPI